MANYFQLISFETKEATSFNQIDEEICAHFGWPVDAEKYAYDWYNAIGFRASMGKTLEEIREGFQEHINIGTLPTATDYEKKIVKYYEVLQCIIDFLEVRYTTNSWCSRG